MTLKNIHYTLYFIGFIISIAFIFPFIGYRKNRNLTNLKFSLFLSVIILVIFLFITIINIIQNKSISIELTVILSSFGYALSSFAILKKNK